MFRIIVTKLPKSRIAERYRVTTHKFHKSVRHNAKDKPDYCPPEPGKSTGTGLVYTLGALALVGGATLGYAKYDPEFREWLKEHVPITDDIIRIVFVEDDTGSKAFTGFLETIKEFILSFFQSEEEEKPKKDREIITDKHTGYQPPKPAFGPAAKNAKTPEENYAEIRLETKVKETEEVVTEIAGVAKDVGKQLPLTHPRNIADLELRIGETAASAIDGYAKALYAIKKYNQELEILIETSAENVNSSVWNELKTLTAEKNKSMREADKMARETAKKISELRNTLNSKELDAPEELKNQSRMNLDNIIKDINKAKKELDDEKEKANLADKYWKKVEQGRNQFGQELEILFPNIDISSKKLNIEDGDMDLFLIYAVSKVLYYQKELVKLETVHTDKLNASIEKAKAEGAELLSLQQICDELEKAKRQLKEDYDKKCLKLLYDTKQSLQEQMKNQSQAFQDHLNDAVKTKEMEIEQKFGRNFDEKLMEERCKFKEQVAAMVGRLKGMDKALKERHAEDKTSEQEALLWSACQALYRAIKSSCPGLPAAYQLRPLTPELSAVIDAAGKGDELVKVVVEGIPEEAKTRGVFPEDTLRERFIKVEKVARRLALVPEEGARLHTFILSYIQAMLLLKAPNPIPQAELNDEETDFSKLSTNEVLQRARYYMDRGDFAQTLRYMNLLKGASRAVARQWMDEARILLETQQAANTLMAHASASGLTN